MFSWFPCYFKRIANCKLHYNQVWTGPKIFIELFFLFLFLSLKSFSTLLPEMITNMVLFCKIITDGPFPLHLSLLCPSHIPFLFCGAKQFRSKNPYLFSRLLKFRESLLQFHRNSIIPVASLIFHLFLWPSIIIINAWSPTRWFEDF